MKNIFIFLFLTLISIAAYPQKKLLNVYIFIAEKCPISIYMTSDLKRITETFNSHADFILVFPAYNSTQKSAVKFKESYNLDSCKIVLDKDHRLTKTLKATITPEVVITNYINQIVYRGRINDSYLEPGKRRHYYTGNDLFDALGLLIENKPVPQPWKPAVGCLITTNE